MALLNNASGSSTLSVLKSLVHRSTEICCVAGYVSLTAISKLGLQEISLDRPVRLLVGMAREDFLLESTISMLAVLDEIFSLAGGGVRICNPACHSKFWIGFTPEGPWTVLGSSNVSIRGLESRREANELDLNGANWRTLQDEFESLWRDSVSVSSAPVRVDEVSQYQRSRPGEAVGSKVDPHSETATVKVSLLDDKGKVHAGDGLNWWRDTNTGKVRAGRKANEACIPIRKGNVDAIEAVLGPLARGTEWHARTSTGRSFDLKLQGGQARYAKQIASKGNLELLGEWILRDMMHLSVKRKVTAAGLKTRLGTTSISITNLGVEPDGKLLVYLSFVAET